jgi:hypothetical protein
MEKTGVMNVAYTFKKKCIVNWECHRRRRYIVLWHRRKYLLLSEDEYA